MSPDNLSFLIQEGFLHLNILEFVLSNSMNKLLSILATVLVCLLIFSCGGDDEPIATSSIGITASDISVSASVSSIRFEDEDDLQNQLNAAIDFDFANSLPTQVETRVITNRTHAIATIEFREEFSSQFIDPNPSNNSVTIDIISLSGTTGPDSDLEGIGASVVTADGPGDTYELITSVLAPGSNPIEVPDCGHGDFGRHIEEVFDEELSTNVFRFILHTDFDDDRCGDQTRQRNEIKSFSQSPDQLLAIEGETVEYTWKFKLDEGFQGSNRFSHIHQLKSVGDVDDSHPMVTLTPRGSTNLLELRYAEFGSSSPVHTEDLDKFRGVWVEVYERVTYTNPGTWVFQIRRIDNGEILFDYSNEDINMWRVGAELIRPKWVLYRSLASVQDLRDEAVLYNDFSIEEFR